MITLHLEYTVDPNRIEAFKTYVEMEQRAIRESGGHIVGYYLPTEFAGHTNRGIGVIDFPTLADYETYRAKLAVHPLHRENADALKRSGAVLSLLRSFIKRVEPVD